jgi:hypothetical protein
MINDTIAPLINMAAGSLTVQCDGAGNTGELTGWLNSHGGAVASDICSDSLIWTNNFTALNDSCGETGTATVIFSVTDDCGNTSTTEATFRITDTTPPTIECPPDATGGIDPVTCLAIDIELGIPTVSDSCSEPVTITNNAPLAGFPVGITIVTWTATDQCGNSATCSHTVTVIDETIPMLECPADTTLSADFEQNYATDVAVDPPYYWDGCNVVVLTWVMSGATTGSSGPTGINIVPVYTYFVGVTTIFYTAVDSSGNIATCSFTVTITSKLEIVCPIDITQDADTGECSAMIDPGEPIKNNGVEPITWTWEMTGATIASGTGKPIVPVPPHEYEFNVGTTTITWIATNISGADTCVQVITVIDNEPPTFTLLVTEVSYCANNIDSALYNPNPTPGIIPEYDDLTYARPEYYLFSEGDTIFNLDPVINNFSDNCCADDGLILHWRIDFSPTPDPSTQAHLPITKPAIADQTGQPSEYGNIEFPADGVDFTDIDHYLYYRLEDCNGNLSAEQMVAITIKPRPNVIKMP